MENPLTFKINNLFDRPLLSHLKMSKGNIFRQ